MPAANQFRLPALRISSTGVAQEDGGGGGGDSTSPILKSPFAARGTGFVLRSTNGATVSHMRVAKTSRVAVPPVGVSTSAVPTVSPPANTRPRPSAVMCPSAFASALKWAISHSWAGGCTPRTMLRVTAVATGAIPTALETPSAPIPPSNLASVSSLRPSEGTSATRTIASSATVLMARPFWVEPVLRGLGASHDSLAGAGCGELADGALHPIARTIALLGGDRVVGRRPWLEALDAHAERRVLMALVQPDGIFRRLAQILGIGAVLHDAVMHVRPPRVVGGPPDDGQMVRGQLERRRFGDLDALGFLGRRKYLRGSRLKREQAADRGRDRECQKQCIHGCSRPWRTRDG